MAATDQALNEFVKRWNLSGEAVSFLGSLPDTLLRTVVAKFNPSGTKDGNVMGRLKGFARSVGQRMGIEVPGLTGPGPDSKAPLVLPKVGDVTGLGDLSSTLGDLGAIAGIAGIAEANEALQAQKVLCVPGLLQFAQTHALTAEMAVFIADLPEEVRKHVIEKFDPAGIKDGNNVWFLVLTFAKAVWANWLGLSPGAASFMHTLPEEIQLTVIKEFDPKISKDSNIDGCLRNFATLVGQRMGVDINALNLGAALDPAAAAALAMGGGIGSIGSMGGIPALGGLSAPLGGVGGMPGLGNVGALGDLGALASVGGTMPSLAGVGGLGDLGGIGRLGGLGSIAGVGTIGGMGALGPASVGVGAIGGGAVGSVTSAPPVGATGAIGDAQTAPSSQESANCQVQKVLSVPGLLDFAKKHGLTAEMAVFMADLPDQVRTLVLSLFNGSDVKDGNAWAHVLKIVKAEWARWLGLSPADSSLMDQLPEDIQLTVIKDFNAQGAKEGELTPRFQAFINSCLVRLGRPASLEFAAGSAPKVGSLEVNGVVPSASVAVVSAVGAKPSSTSDHGAMAMDLDEMSKRFLQALPVSIKDVVSAKFSAQGARDGKVFGRLLGFTRAAWLKYLGLDNTYVDFMRGLPEEVQATVIAHLEPGSLEDGKVGVRLMEFVKAVLSRRAQLPGKPPALGNAMVVATVGGAVATVPAGGAVGGGALAAAPVPAASKLPEMSTEDQQALVEFLKRGGLAGSVEAAQLLINAPSDIREKVFADFDVRGPEEENVLGRLIGFMHAVSKRKQRDGSVAPMAKKPKLEAKPSI